MSIFKKLISSIENTVHTRSNVSDDEIVAPVSGEILDIKTVPDRIFADQLMGKTLAIKVSEGSTTICSPCNGKMKVVFPTGHAFGIIMNDGSEVLVHIGIDTVDAKGRGFELLDKKQGDDVKAGDEIVTVDFKELSKTFQMPVFVVITKKVNDNYAFITPHSINKGEKIIK